MWDEKSHFVFIATVFYPFTLMFTNFVILKHFLLNHVLTKTNLAMWIGQPEQNKALWRHPIKHLKILYFER